MADHWLTKSPRLWGLFVPALLFYFLVALRRWCYRRGWLRSTRLPVPVVVVGNITAGGAGKTPVVLFLAQQLSALGRRPGIVSRGYGGAGDVAEVLPDSNPQLTGDEPLLLKQRSACPVFVARRRVNAAHALLAAHPECDVILCDDGLQHLALARDVEIAVLDRRGLMNGWPLPAGPLREPASRLQTVDAVVLNGLDRPPATASPIFRMNLVGRRFYRLDRPEDYCDADTLAAQAASGVRFHAVAGIGDPRRFFDHLSDLGLCFEAHAFPDHHTYRAEDLDLIGDALLTTEKDAVKFTSLAPRLPVWVLPVEARIEPDLARFVLEKLDGSPSA